ncbi:phosphotransferase [Demequina sp.]|uniref:phosphotransferase n=1 Tax=Demequina sp. TaxID=2050685 RepID=UPI0025C1B75C|nr:phosphotransferase [Demequina sp.]
MAASHLVAHDALRRGPDERARMLRRIGIRRIVWDWREEHLGAFDAELDALRRHQVALSGMWTPLPMPAFEEPDYASRFGVVPMAIKTLITEAARRGYAPDLWTQIGFGQAGAQVPLSNQAHQAEVNRAADHLAGLARLARGHGMCVVLTNHGGWAGEPRTLVGVVQELARRGLGNVGIGFRLQHAHHLIADLDHHIKTMEEHLVAFMLSGADAGAELSGRVILPFGAGSRDRWVTHALLESGWRGQLVIHAVGQDDSEARLLDSLDGWEWSVDRFLRHPRPRPVPRILEPTWPPNAAWTGRAVAPTRAERTVRADAVLAAQATAAVSAATVATAADPAVPRAAAAQPAPASPDTHVPGPHVPTPYGQRAPERQPARTESTAAYFRAPNAAPPRPPATPPLPPAAPSPPPAVDLGPTRRQRRAEREEGERTAREATKAARNAQREAARGPERIGHRDVRIIAPDPYTGAIHALLLHLEDAGFTGAPRSFGWDDKGRHLVEFVPGTRADHPKAPEAVLDPARIGRFMSDMHDALESFEPPDYALWFDGLPPPGGDLIVHHDIAPSNIVVRADGTLVAIDWDAAGPGTRLWDLAYAAHAFTPLYQADADLAHASRRLRGLVDGYGLDDAHRKQLVPLLAMRSQRMYEYLDKMRATGVSPWTDLWDRGIGTVWKADAQWIRDHSDVWERALLS